MNNRDLQTVFMSPNEADRNGEPANVVDGLYAIARALTHIGNNLAGLGEVLGGVEQALRGQADRPRKN